MTVCQEYKDEEKKADKAAGRARAGSATRKVMRKPVGSLPVIVQAIVAGEDLRVFPDKLNR